MFLCGVDCSTDEIRTTRIAIRLRNVARLRSWRQRRRIGCQIHHVFDAKLFDGGLHQRTSGASPRAIFEVIELSHKIARRAARDAGNRPHAFEVGPVADATLHRFAATTVRGEQLSFPDAARRNIRGESGARVPVSTRRSSLLAQQQAGLAREFRWRQVGQGDAGDRAELETVASFVSVTVR